MKKLALLVAFSGLFVVCYDKLFLEHYAVPIAYLDLTMLFLSVILFSLSGVLVKTINIGMHPLASTVGTITLSMPVFVVLWWVIDGNLAQSQFGMKSTLSIIYLGVYGSLFGFIAYFYVLKRLPASTVSLVTLITPGMAIFLGSQFNDEQITYNLLLGTGLVLMGLFLYFFADKIYSVGRIKFKSRG